MRHIISTAFILLMSVGLARAVRELHYPKADSPHYLYLPDKIDPAQTYWVVVGVHGAGGRPRGANGMASWADKKDNVIVLGPKFGTTYQNAYPPDQEILLDLFKKLQKEYKVHPKMFIYGFSGGSQFAHRFVMNQPGSVCGLSSHSGGSWATDGFGKINEDARNIPFAISCGGNDTGKAWSEAPFNRLDWYKRFEHIMEEKEFFYKGAIWTNVGHRASHGVSEMTEECFQLATKGILPGSKLDKQLAEVSQLAEAGKFDEAQKLKYELRNGSVALPERSGWHDSQEALAARRELVNKALDAIDISPAARRLFGLYTQCVQLLKSDKKPEDMVLLSFVSQCPPSYWKGKQDSKLVFDACNVAAKNYAAGLREQKKLNMPTYKMLIQGWEGLEVREDLLKEYDQEAGKYLDKILAMQEGSFKQRALKSFITQWQVGEAVSKAKAALRD